MQETQWVRANVVDYLCDYIRKERPKSIAAWVPDDVSAQVAETVTRLGQATRLQPIFQALEGRVSYDQIRIVLTDLLP
jgi:uncharacterized protein YpbB